MCSTRTGYFICNSTVLDQSSDLETKLNLTVLVAVMVLVFSANLMISVVLYKSTRIPKSTLYCMTSLCVADLMIGWLLVVHLVGAITGRWLFGPWLCQMLPQLKLTVLSATVQTLVIMNIERYIAIMFPLKYNIWITSKRMLCVLLVNWTISIVMYSISFNISDIQFKYSREAYMCVIVFPNMLVLKRSVVATPTILLLISVLLVFMNLHIYRIAKSYQERIQQQRLFQLGSQLTMPQRPNIRGLRTVLVAMGCFMICWLPSSSSLVLSIYDIITVSRSAMFFFHMMMYANSFCNWFIYFITHASFKKEQMKIWEDVKKCLVKQRNLDSS